jgi:DNA-binding winged helix-turn-helix (wHTH) protein/tetratricopeptide (TPR) repeat protein
MTRSNGLVRYEFANAWIDEVRQELFVDGQSRRLEPRVAHLLLTMLRQAGQTIPTQVLRDQVWQGRPTVDNVVANAITKLRRQLGPAGAAHIVNRARVGYLLDGEVRRVELSADLGGEAAALWHQLPALPVPFVGRALEVDQCAQQLLNALAAGDLAPAVLVLEGAGGVGKTSLAAAIAHALASQFPAFQLVLSLRHYGSQPLTADEARDALLTQVYPGWPLPRDDVVRWGVYQRLFQAADGSARPGLLIVDDCGRDADLEKLLPNVRLPVLVTSRRSLGSAPGTVVKPLGLEDSAALLVALSPSLRSGEHAESVARRCGGFPIALRAVAGQARRTRRRGEALQRWVDDWLAGLEAPNGATGTAAASQVLARSLQDLSEHARSALQALTVFAQPFDHDAAVSVAACTDATIDLLVERHLLEVDDVSGQLFWLDLIRDLIRAPIGPAMEEWARRRHARYFVAVLREASLPYEIGHGDFDAAQAGVSRHWANIQQAIDWLASVPGNATSWKEVAGAVRATLIWHRVPLTTSERWFRRALEEAETAGYLSAEGACQRFLGFIAMWRGQRQEARTLFEAARVTHKALGEIAYEADACRGLGELARIDGQLEEAGRLFEYAVARYVEIGHRVGEVHARRGLAILAGAGQDKELVTRRFREVLALAESIGDTLAVAAARSSMADVAARASDWEAARDSYEQALAAYSRSGDRLSAAVAAGGLAQALLNLGDLDGAQFHNAASLKVCRSACYSQGEGHAWLGLGDVALARDDAAGAHACYASAADLYHAADHEPGRDAVRARLTALANRSASEAARTPAPDLDGANR